MHGNEFDVLLAAPVFETVEQAALRGWELEFQIKALCSARDIGVTLRDLHICRGDPRVLTRS
jgi:hypothetical protein